MAENKGKFYMTTAIAYTSGKPHIGNTYEIILADAIARYKRAEGYDVYFQTGTDEHGQKIQEKAEAADISPKEFVDQVSGEVKRIWDLVNSSYDNFVRTTDEDHEKCVKKIFKKLYDQGDIYKGSYEGMYCTPCESFWTESQLVDGKGPDCGRPAQCIIDGQPNIYSIFMAISALLLAEQGQMIYITPRSFTSGRYFRLFRNFLFKHIQIDFVHLFNTRKDTFSKDNVLQETIIMKCSPKKGADYNVVLSYSEGLSDLATPAIKEVQRKEIIDLTSKELILHLPVSLEDEKIIRLFK